MMKLAQWLKTEKVTMAAFAERVGVTHSAVSRWCSGEIFPQGEKLIAIRSATNGLVSADDFMPAETEDAAD